MPKWGYHNQDFLGTTLCAFATEESRADRESIKLFARLGCAKVKPKSGKKKRKKKQL
jgi:hypothetical protein